MLHWITLAPFSRSGSSRRIGLLDPEDRGTMFIQSNGNYLAVNIMYTSKKTWILVSMAVTTSKQGILLSFVDSYGGCTLNRPMCITDGY